MSQKRKIELKTKGKKGRIVAAFVRCPFRYPHKIPLAVCWECPDHKRYNLNHIYCDREEIGNEQ